MGVAFVGIFIIGVGVGIWAGTHIALRRLGKSERRERFAKIWGTKKP